MTKLELSSKLNMEMKKGFIWSFLVSLNVGILWFKLLLWLLYGTVMSVYQYKYIFWLDFWKPSTINIFPTNYIWIIHRENISCKTRINWKQIVGFGKPLVSHCRVTKNNVAKVRRPCSVQSPNTRATVI